MFAYCLNTPVVRVDPTGEFCVAHADDRNYLNDWIIEGGGCGGSGGSGNCFGYGTSYHNYSVYSATSTYNAGVGGYYSNFVTSGLINPNYYYVPGAVSVPDNVATDNLHSQSSSTSQVHTENKRFSSDQDALLQLAKEYKKTGEKL